MGAHETKRVIEVSERDARGGREKVRQERHMRERNESPEEKRCKMRGRERETHENREKKRYLIGRYRDIREKTN